MQATGCTAAVTKIPLEVFVPPSAVTLGVNFKKKIRNHEKDQGLSIWKKLIDLFLVSL